METFKSLEKFEDKDRDKILTIVSEELGIEEEIIETKKVIKAEEVDIMIDKYETEKARAEESIAYWEAVKVERDK